MYQVPGTKYQGKIRWNLVLGTRYLAQISCYARHKMLLELRVENYAVIDQVAVEFAPGLNLLTGETGAGKSILIDALALLLGDKASTDVIRHGSDKAIIA